MTDVVNVGSFHAPTGDEPRETVPFRTPTLPDDVHESAAEAEIDD